MKSTVLNTTQLTLLEELMLRFGQVVTYEQVAPLIPASDPVAKRQFVSKLVNAGWLVRIKKGVYQVADLTDHPWSVRHLLSRYGPYKHFQAIL